MLSSKDDSQKSKIAKGGFNRLAASDYGRDAWVTILSRLATRASAGLEDPQEGIKDEHAISNSKGSLSISDTVRDGMYNYILSDWKRRIDVLPYVEHTDKIILRFLSEVPALNYDILVRLKKMAEDPERIDLACSALHYLHMFRPPVRGIVVDILAEIYQTNDRARPSAKKLLARWRPEVLSEEDAPPIKTEGGQLAKESANGSLEVKAAS